jgi:hypothetical protein
MLFTRERVVERAAKQTSDDRALRKALSSERLLESATKARDSDRFDIFLSHARIDEDVVYGAKLELERRNYSVYVDWIDDPQLDRNEVDRLTAALLRRRMRRCSSLLYVWTEHSRDSLWMPWELGYFDGFANRAAVFPVVDTPADEYFGVEYLSLYPYLDLHRDTEGSWRLWVNKPRSRSVYAPLRSWLKNSDSLHVRTRW